MRRTNRIKPKRMRAAQKRAVLKPHRDLRPLVAASRTLPDRKYSRIWP